ncbi:MAG: orotidine-5'-phosphate decarboxylase [Candidatus Omnitrophica bacterium]|nr:orotidine-5'-phosphate decarboxylase [Candidatus Omnitrophota bacterium]MDD5351645.1 orotidine-5'-phosphate decarboxylase [Candidatus Omnitrophota bacterium]MDD5550855.1 orotidine-5'-phosphate decarboxylase [Candidatus Omnitrophota bacterium]
MSCIDNKTKLIVALDVDTVDKAKYFVDRLYPRVKIFKVGLQLFTLAGPGIIQCIHAKGAKVFLDLKLFDIPNTVANASREMVRLGVDMFTVHVQGGPDMLKRAKDAATEESHKLGIKPPLIIGVTILTSEGKKTNIPARVLSLAKLAKQCGLSGVVCSVNEAKAVREKLGKDFIIVTPGIRLPTDKKGDQKRVATPAQAIKAGSNYLVVGRPILEADDPLAALEQLCK